MEKDDSFLHANYNDRTSVLEKTKNVSLIRRFFKGSIEFDYENNFFNSRRELKPPQFELTNKYGIFFSIKGGSSAITTIFKEYGLSDLNITTNKIYGRYISSKIGFKQDILIDELVKPIEEILNGKSKKDLIIVIRNPVYKFLSGLYQDVSFELQSSDVLLGIVSNKYDVKYNHKDNDDKIKSLNDSAICFLAYNLLKYRLSSGQDVASSHSDLYNEFYYSLLTNNNIDSSKLKIVDIDDPNSDLIKCLGEYNPEIIDSSNNRGYWTHRGHHEMLLNGIEKLCLEDNNFELLKAVKSEINNDFHYYTLIRQNYKDNVYIK